MIDCVVVDTSMSAGSFHTPGFFFIHDGGDSVRELLLPYHHHLEVSTSWSLPSFGFVATVFVVVVFKCVLVYRTVKAKEC